MIEGSNILLVDDNPEIVEILYDFLTMNGCNVHKAFTGKEALDFLDKSKVEIILLDVKLPDANGIAMLDSIKINNPTTAVVMITGYYDTNYVVDAMRKGASDFLIKPFEFDKLILVLMRALRERDLLLEKASAFQYLEDKRKIEILNRQLHKKISELTTMYHISNQFNSLNVYDDVYEKMVQIIGNVVDTKSCGYYILDHRNGELILYTELKKGSNISNEEKIPMTDDFVAHLQSPRKYLVKDNKLFVPVLIKGEPIGFVMVNQSTNGKKEDHASKLDSNIYLLKAISEKASTQIENKMLYESLFENVFRTLTSLIATINKRDFYTENHCQRVTELCISLAERYGIEGYEKDVIKVVGPIHDLGKVGIPDAILLKPGKLTDEEYYIMKCHSAYGEEIMSRFELLANEAMVIRSHHERFDGKGYPDGLMGEEINICSRIIAVCDSFDAMTSDRPYRKGMKVKDALAEIERCKGTQFDPSIADCFIEMVMTGGIHV